MSFLQYLAVWCLLLWLSIKTLQRLGDVFDAFFSENGHPLTALLFLIWPMFLTWGIWSFISAH